MINIVVWGFRILVIIAALFGLYCTGIIVWVIWDNLKNGWWW